METSLTSPVKPTTLKSTPLGRTVVGPKGKTVIGKQAASLGGLPHQQLPALLANSFQAQAQSHRLSLFTAFLNSEKLGTDFRSPLPTAPQKHSLFLRKDTCPLIPISMNWGKSSFLGGVHFMEQCVRTGPLWTRYNVRMNQKRENGESKPMDWALDPSDFLSAGSDLGENTSTKWSPFPGRSRAGSRARGQIRRFTHMFAFWEKAPCASKKFPNKYVFISRLLTFLSQWLAVSSKAIQCLFHFESVTIQVFNTLFFSLSVSEAAL